MIYALSTPPRQTILLLYIALVVTLSLLAQLGVGTHLHDWTWG